jgi:deferrochelatase/peroxidase EfeB
MAMNNSGDFEYDDLQGLVCFGYGKLPETCFLLLNIVDAAAAKQWLGKAPISNAVQIKPPPKTAAHLAFTAAGLHQLGLTNAVIEDFPDEFIVGMAGDESRSRRLGDIDENAPSRWLWGGDANNEPHLLLMLYAETNGIKNWRKTVEDGHFATAFKLLKELPTADFRNEEPFGFADGISQPKIDWARQQSTDDHKRDSYSNLLAIGEIVLGYPNEYSQYNPRPLLNPKTEPAAVVLPNAEDQPTLKDFGRNGCFLVLRQLEQDVPKFWQFVDKASGLDATKRQQLAAAMVGRNLDGSPLVAESKEAIPGIDSTDQKNNQFTYNDDTQGRKCPISAHVRRSNPRTGDMTPGKTGWLTRFFKILGFCNKRPDDDLVASSRFHRLLRRGRSYGPVLTPDEAVKADAQIAERGLQFMCLVANISRQFEFVQNAWVINSKFAGLQLEQDPLLGNRHALYSGDSTDHFNRPDSSGLTQKTCALPQFITVRGGGYFFMPGLRAIKYLSALPNPGSGKVS